MPRCTRQKCFQPKRNIYFSIHIFGCHSKLTCPPPCCYLETENPTPGRAQPPAAAAPSSPKKGVNEYSRYISQYSEASWNCIWNTCLQRSSFKEICWQNPCWHSYGFCGQASRFQVEGQFEHYKRFKRLLRASGHIQQKEWGSRCFPWILCSTKFRGHL